MSEIDRLTKTTNR